MSGAARPSWQGIRDDVLGRIRAGVWRPGDLLPTETELAAELGCARATVSRALRELAEAGLLDRRRRAGTRVSAPEAARARLSIPLVHRDVAARGGRYGYALIEAALSPLPAAIRGRLRPTGPEPWLRVRALHLANGRPHAYEDRWINPPAVPAVLEADLARTSANEWLVEHAPFTAGEMQVSAAAAEPDVAAHLEIAEGSPLFVVERTTWQGETPITFARQSFVPGHSIDLELTAGTG